VRWPAATSGDALEVRVNPKAPPITPVNWSAGTGAADPIPPSSYSAETAYCTLSHPCDGTYTSGIAACTAWDIEVHNPPEGNVQVVSGGAYCQVGSLGHFTALSSGLFCKTGYTRSGGTCNLTNAAAVPYPTDGVGQKKVVAGVITDESRDPDNATPAGVGVTATQTQITVQVGTTTSTFKVNADGTSTVSVTTGNGNGTSTRITANMAQPDAGASDGGTKASGVKAEQVIGEGGSAATEPTGTVFYCNNCATEATAAVIKSDIGTIKTDGVKIKEDASTWATEKTQSDSDRAAALKASDDHKKRFVDSAGGDASKLGITGFGNWVAGTAENVWTGLFPSPATCQPVAISFHGSSQWDLCPFASLVRGGMEWALYVLSVFYIYALFWRRRDVAG
jgi:hypothetical protein